MTQQSNQGWVCPNCGKVLSPYIKECTCKKVIKESKESVKWIKD